MVNGPDGGKIATRTLYSAGSNPDIPVNSFIKVLSCFEYSGNIYTCPVYFYTGSPSSGRYDFIWPDGISKSSVAISSDAAVI